MVFFFFFFLFKSWIPVEVLQPVLHNPPEAAAAHAVGEALGEALLQGGLVLRPEGLRDVGLGTEKKKWSYTSLYGKLNVGQKGGCHIASFNTILVVEFSQKCLVK